MLYYIAPFVILAIIGFFGAQSKKLLPIAFIAVVGAGLVWVSNITPLFSVSEIIKANGLKSAFNAVWAKANPIEHQMLYLGLAGLPVGYIAGRLLKSVNANGKLESKADRKRRILAEHGMREFD